MQLAIACTIQRHSNQPGQLHKLIHTQGHVRSFYENDMAKVGAFRLQCPEAAIALPYSAGNQHQTTQGFLTCLADLLTGEGYTITVHHFKLRLGEPQTQQEAIREMERLARIEPWINPQAMEKAQSASSSHGRIRCTRTKLRAFTTQSLNRYRAREPQHLAKALATALITWEALQKWLTLPGLDTQRDQQGPANKEELQAESQVQAPFFPR